MNNEVTWIFHGDVFDTKAVHVCWPDGQQRLQILILFSRFVNFILKAFGPENYLFPKGNGRS